MQVTGQSAQRLYSSTVIVPRNSYMPAPLTNKFDSIFYVAWGSLRVTSAVFVSDFTP